MVQLIDRFRALLEAESGNCLGIYLGRADATVVCLGGQGRDRNVLGCFSVSVEQPEDPDKMGTLVGLIAEGCAGRDLEFSEVAVALDCAMFMQHNVHSEFNDPKQIAATVRFDAEEALAMDITDVAIAFKITSSSPSGSELAVFTARRKILSDVLGCLQDNNIDPVTIEPDVNCLSRFICRNVSLAGDLHPFFGILSRHSGYFIVPSPAGGALAGQSVMRTFLLSPAQDRAELLAREVPVTVALVESGGPINCLKVFDSAGSVNIQMLAEKLAIEVGGLDLAASARLEPEALADCADTVDFAIACGAALAHLEKPQSINFRSDFSPYQGRKVQLLKALKFLSISVTVLVFAVGLYFQLQLLQRNRQRSRLGDKLAGQYSSVMFGKKLPAKSDPVKKLAGELRRIRDAKQGLIGVTGQQSVSSKLTIVLEAFNSCAAATNLKIDSISITAKSISIAGQTSSRANTLKLFEAIKGKMRILQQHLDAKGGRDSFRITVVPKE